MEGKERLVKLRRNGNVIRVGRKPEILDDASYLECLEKLVYCDTQVLAGENVLEAMLYFDAQVMTGENSLEAMLYLDTRGVVAPKMSEMKIRVEAYVTAMKEMASVANKRIKQLEDKMLERKARYGTVSKPGRKTTTTPPDEGRNP